MINRIHSFPCYCCSKITNAKAGHYVITTDGYNFMSFSSWLAFTAENNFNYADPATAYDLAGCGWRPEVYGSVCYKKLKAKHKDATELKTSDGSKWLFITELPVDLS